MGWRFGIPDFIGMYTYFKDLQNTEDNVPLARIRKENLYALAVDTAKNVAHNLTMPKNLKQANDFLAQVATSERNKELMVIKSFCKQTGQQFQALQPFLQSPDLIQKNPDEFYIQLTAALNRIRRGTQEYLNELKRIKKNIQEKGRTLENYKADDYRYRLDGDINSFLNRLTGQYIASNKKKTENAYSIKVQKLVMKILQESNLTEKLQSGENFAAIASALLIEVEKEVQQEIDQALANNQDNTVDEIIDTALQQIESKYLKIAHKQQQATSPIERAIEDISSLEFERITRNAKEILGITSAQLSLDEEKKLLDKVRHRDSRIAKNNLDIASIRQGVKSNRTLSKNLALTNFSISGSANSRHGTIYELVESIFSGTKIAGKGATDILTVTTDWQFQTDNESINTLMTSISSEITNAIAEQQSIQPNQIKDTRDIIISMNNKITALIEKAEKQLSEMKQFNIDNIFIFHETLKLYSSAETGNGKHAGFGGRKIGIMDYIDDLYATQNAGIPVSRDELGFLALNIMDGAVAERQRNPLEHYLSLYAGMIMFDDLSNMAQEAIQQINKFDDKRTGKIIQIHLYNLNGIYVPASMFLSYISDAMKEASNFADNGLIAQAKIYAPSVNTNYKDWVEGNWKRNKDDITLDGPQLRPEHWRAVAAESAQSTKVEITFLAAFKSFIKRL